MTEVGRVDGTGKRRDAWSRQGDGVDVIRRDIAGSGGIGGSLSKRVAGMPARHELDGHVRDDIPLFS